MNKLLLALLLVVAIAAIVVGALVYTQSTAPGASKTPASGTPTATTTPAGKPVGAKRKLVIFCAGSLYIPLKRLAEVYEKLHPDVEVVIEPSGSVKAVRKVADLHRRCDVLALADYRLIPSYMIPRYAKWYIAFASNRVVLAYTPKSKYANEITPENWYEILARPGVRYGFSNPNDDPCGYRTVTVISLASLLYNKPILDKLVISKTNIHAEKRGDELHIYVPANLEVKRDSGLVVRSKSVDLIALLEAGVLDYAFEYLSVAVQHNLSYVMLPAELNLGDLGHADTYSKVVVHILYGTEKEREIRGAPIVYGVTIPVTAENTKDAIEFVKLLLSDTGRRIFQECGQPFLDKFFYGGELPEELKHLVEGR